MWKPTTQADPERMPGILKALGEPQRIAILRLVHERELPAGEIASHFKTTRQAVSKQLNLLSDAGLLEIRRDGTRRLYRVNREAFGELQDFLDVFWRDRLSSLKTQVAASRVRTRGGK